MWFSFFRSNSAQQHQEQQQKEPFFRKEGSRDMVSQSEKQPTNSFFSSAAKGGVQPKLTIGQPNDRYEQEADEMAERVVGQGHSSATLGAPAIQSKCAECEAEETGQKKEALQEKPLQRKPAFETENEETEAVQTKSDRPVAATSGLQSQLAGSSGAGRPLPKDTQAQMEGSFGTDFSGVRVHTGEDASQMNRSLNARAFTHGNDIYFNEGQYDTGSGEGQKLLAHELTHVVQQGGGQKGGGVVQRGLWGAIKGAARSVGRGIASGVSAVGGAISSGISTVGSAIGSGVSAIGGALGSAWNTATRFLGGAASWAWEGMKALGSTAWSWLSTAGSHVWAAIRWLGDKAWEGIKWLGTFLWEKLALIGTNLWSFLSNIPVRLWRIIVHGWEGVKGALSWAWSGLRGAAGHLWNGVSGVFSWLGEGLGGAVNWLMNGIQSGFNWAIDFIQNPSLSKLWDALTGSLSWAWDGLKGFARWGWNGVTGAAVWVWQGLKGFGSWIWDGIVGGAEWAGRMLLYVLELAGLGEALQIIWGLIFRMRKLTQAEIDASKLVHPPGMIPYSLIRVDENSVISMIGGAAVTTFHVIHTPKGGIPLDVMVHELTHVAQYENVGAVYMPEAIHAQVKYGRSGGRGSGSAYDYERNGPLATQRAAGKKFSDLNRESQAELVQDYYLCLTSTPPNPCLDHVPFINDMQRGEF